MGPGSVEESDTGGWSGSNVWVTSGGGVEVANNEKRPVYLGLIFWQGRCSLIPGGEPHLLSGLIVLCFPVHRTAA